MSRSSTSSTRLTSQVPEPKPKSDTSSFPSLQVRTLPLPENICLYLQTANSYNVRQRQSFFVQPGTNMISILGQVVPKKISYKYPIRPEPILQILAEPGRDFGMYIYIGKNGILPYPCRSNGSNIFKNFLFDALRKEIESLGVTSINEFQFQIIHTRDAPDTRHSPDGNSFRLTNFHDGGVKFRLYGSVLMAGDEVDDMIVNNKSYGNEIFIVSDDGIIPLEKRQRIRGGRKRKTRKSKKSKKSKKTRKSRSRSKVRH